ncbi:MAG: polyphosphate polymerase domain-containing protein [Gemmata sp.]
MSDLSDSAKECELGSPAGHPAAAPRGLESPSLFRPGDEDATAYEVKYLLTEEQVRAVVDRVTGKLALDPYADPALGNAYQTTSIYTDTPTYDVFSRNEGYAADKFRVRRYGVSGPVFVERKTKNGDKVSKHRARIDAREIGDLAAPVLSGEWAGEWFHSALLQKQLRPVCRIAYERVAYLGTADGGTVRLTFDRNIRGVLIGQWTLEQVGAAKPLVDLVVCEMKFRSTMPALFRGVVVDLALAQARVSKYRTFVRAMGLVPEVRAAAAPDALVVPGAAPNG